MKYTYYPGCSLHATGVGYDKSIRAVFSRLGHDLVELDDWNCCGATAYTSVRKTVAYTISARNLALAARVGDDVVAPCSACYYVLNRTRKALAEQPELRDRVGLALAEAGLEVGDGVPVRHPLEVLLTDVGIDRILAAQTHSIAGFRPACYYGCQIVRPLSALDEDPELPTSMERLFSALGAEPVDYPPKVRCCGGMLVATFPEVAAELCEALFGWADERGANCIVTVCPLCQANLDLLNLAPKRRNGSRPIPVLYFTQIIGLAIGCSPAEVGLEHGLTEVTVEVPPLAVTTGGSRHD
ncbi:MAG: CoB--CoM heterodisulfide reductase iron-sulfur subunit B family protein [Actinomycetota bacterium]